MFYLQKQIALQYLDVSIHVNCTMDKVGAIYITLALCKQAIIVTQICVIILAVVVFVWRTNQSDGSNIT